VKNEFWLQERSYGVKGIQQCEHDDKGDALINSFSWRTCQSVRLCSFCIPCETWISMLIQLAKILCRVVANSRLTNCFSIALSSFAKDNRESSLCKFGFLIQLINTMLMYLCSFEGVQLHVWKFLTTEERMGSQALCCVIIFRVRFPIGCKGDETTRQMIYW
jgi:hypothetical protein